MPVSSRWRLVATPPMRQYQVPQFITIEDKVIGPLTIKQALYIGAGVVIIVLARINFESYLFWPIAVFTGGFSLLLAFAKINEQPFPTIVKNAILYITRPRLYIWKKRDNKTQTSVSVLAQKKTHPPQTQASGAVKKIPKLSDSKLSDLAWSLDIKEMWKAKEEEK